MHVWLLALLKDHRRPTSHAQVAGCLVLTYADLDAHANVHFTIQQSPISSLYVHLQAQLAQVTS